MKNATISLSPARSALIAAQKSRDAIAESLTQKRATEHNLHDASRTLQTSRDALAAFDSESSSRAEAWAADGCTGARPEPDRSTRAKLEQAVREADADASAMQSAVARLGQESLTLQSQLQAAQETERAARLAVIVEDGVSVVGKLRTAAHEAVTLAFQVVSLRNLLMLAAGNSEADRRASVRFLDELSVTRRDNAEALVPVSWVLATNHSSEQMASFRELQNEWSTLLDQLASNPAATVAPATDAGDIQAARAA